jgi:hypothetical protein
MSQSSGAEYPRCGKLPVTPLDESTAEASPNYRSTAGQKLFKNEQWAAHPCFRGHGNHYCGFGVAAATA